MNRDGGMGARDVVVLEGNVSRDVGGSSTDEKHPAGGTGRGCVTTAGEMWKLIPFDGGAETRLASDEGSLVLQVNVAA